MVYFNRNRPSEHRLSAISKTALFDQVEDGDIWLRIGCR